MAAHESMHFSAWHGVQLGFGRLGTVLKEILIMASATKAHTCLRQAMGKA